MISALKLFGWLAFYLFIFLVVWMAGNLILLGLQIDGFQFGIVIEACAP